MGLRRAVDDPNRAARAQGRYQAVVRVDHAHRALVCRTRLQTRLGDDLPANKRDMYNYQRRSKVLFKTL
jgi:hypothetical protein